MRNVGDVIAIYRYEDKDHSSPSGIGVVLKVYNEDRCFIKLLRNYRIPVSKCQNWKKLGVTDGSGYYVRLEDKSHHITSTQKTTYTVSPVIAYAYKTTSRSNGGLENRGGYTKKYQKTVTEVYYFNLFDEIIPRFVLIRDLSNPMTVISQVAVEKSSSETPNEIARRAYAMMQVSKYERLVK